MFPSPHQQYLHTTTDSPRTLALQAQGLLVCRCSQAYVNSVFFLARPRSHLTPLDVSSWLGPYSSTLSYIATLRTSLSLLTKLFKFCHWARLSVALRFGAFLGPRFTSCKCVMIPLWPEPHHQPRKQPDLRRSSRRRRPCYLGHFVGLGRESDSDEVLQRSSIFEGLAHPYPLVLRDLT